MSFLQAEVGMLNTIVKSSDQGASSESALSLPPANGVPSPSFPSGELQRTSAEQSPAPRSKPALGTFDKQAEVKAKTLIEELGSEDFHSREAASQDLLLLGQTFRGTSQFRDLLSLTTRTHPDPEVRSRSASLQKSSTFEYLTFQEETIQQLASNPLGTTSLGKWFLEQKRNEIHELFVNVRIAPSLFGEASSTRALSRYSKVFGLEDLVAEYAKTKDEGELSKLDQSAFASFSKLQTTLAEVSDRTGKFFVESEEDRNYRRIILKANDLEHRVTLRVQGSIEPIPGSTAYRNNGGSLLSFDSELVRDRNVEDYVFKRRIASIPRTEPRKAE